MSLLGDQAAPGQHKGDEKRAREREYVTSWLQGNSAKHLITAVPGNLNLSKKIPSSPCLIAVDGCCSVMHDNARVSRCSLPVLIPVSFHSRWWTRASGPCEGVWARDGGGVGWRNPSWREAKELALNPWCKEKEVLWQKCYTPLQSFTPFPHVCSIFIFLERKTKLGHTMQMGRTSVTWGMSIGSMQASCIVNYISAHAWGWIEKCKLHLNIKEHYLFLVIPVLLNLFCTRGKILFLLVPMERKTPSLAGKMAY